MRWRMLILMALARLALGLQFQTLASTSEYLIADFALSYTQIGTLIGLFMLPGLVLAIPAGMLGRYTSDRQLVALGLGLLSLGGFIAALADGYTQIAVGRLFCGAGFVFSTIYFTKMVADWFSGREIATALSILVMTWPLGIALGQVGHEWISANLGWAAAFNAASAYGVLAMAAVALLYRAPDAGTGSNGAPTWSLSGQEVLLILVASLSWALFNAGYVVYLSFAPKLLTIGGMSALLAATTISLASWLMMGSGIVCGQLADRTKRPDLIIYLCMAGAIVGLLLLGVSGGAVPSSLILGLLGVAPAGLIVALSADAMRPENRALGMGLYFSIYFLVVAPAPAIAGWLFDTTGDAFHPILFSAGLFALTGLSNWLFRLLQRRLA